MAEPKFQANYINDSSDDIDTFQESENVSSSAEYNGTERINNSKAGSSLLDKAMDFIGAMIEDWDD